MKNLSQYVSNQKGQNKYIFETFILFILNSIPFIYLYSYILE